MKALVKTVCLFVALSCSALAQAETENSVHLLLKSDVRECGDLATTLGSITGSVAVQEGRMPPVDVSSQAAANYFLAKFQACTCLRELTGNLGVGSINGCFVKSYAAATLYRTLLKDDVISFLDVPDTDLEAMF